jgi:hypothetical protein
MLILRGLPQKCFAAEGETAAVEDIEVVEYQI